MNAVAQNAIVIDGGVAQVFDHIENGGPMWAGSGRRWARAVVNLEETFDQPPKVQLSIAMIDADSAKNLRLELIAEDVTTNSFTVVAHTWNDSRIGRLQVNWTAIGVAEPAFPGAWRL